MSVREFDGTDDRIDAAIGGCGVVTAFTLAVVFKSDTFHAGGLLCVTRASDFVAGYGLNPFSDGKLYCSANGFSGESYPFNGVWVLAVFSKASGTVLPRFHMFRWDTETWSHAAGSGLISDQNAFGMDKLRFGQWRNNAEFFNGKYAAAAVYNSELSDGTIETFRDGVQDMLNASPVGLWRFNQENVSDPIEDLSGNGADQTGIVGTSVIVGDDPPDFSMTLAVENARSPRRSSYGHVRRLRGL